MHLSDKIFTKGIEKDDIPLRVRMTLAPSLKVTYVELLLKYNG